MAHVKEGGIPRQHLELLRDLGGTAIRTWGIEQLDQRGGGDRTLLDRRAAGVHRR